ncbi:unnamed protein product [Parnassius mnemosyne]|uniref:Uncharacterized protein n=1 Tax=Parnassius mnemosyne TaxID=213953 RepID=A0AAV1KAD3_9NEOP
MDRYVIREPRSSNGKNNVNFCVLGNPQTSHIIAFSPSTSDNNLTVFKPDNLYYGGYGSDISNIQRASNAGLILGNSGHIVSGIDPRYLAAYTDGSATYLATGQEQIPTQQNLINADTTDRVIYGQYQNKNFVGPEKPTPRKYVPQITGKEQVQTSSDTVYAKNDAQNQLSTRQDKLKALNKSGPRAFSGPVEKVLKWHKSLQEVGILILYEIVAKCVSVRSGDSCAKILVVRDENGPAMQVVYYEIDFLLPELKLPCMIRVIGRMLYGTCRLQAFHVRPATGDDVATLPRRAAVAQHHVTKLCKEYTVTN